MNNMVYLIGRLTKDVELVNEDGKENATITVASQRSYKNADGIYETDFIDCTLWNGIARNCAEYCKKGDLVGINGRLETFNVENEDGEKKKITRVVVDKLTFLASKKGDE